MRESRSKAGRIRLRGGLLFPMGGEVAHRGDLWIEGNRIAAVTPPDSAPSWSAESMEEREVRGLWVLPGFVQAHTHLCQTLFRGMAERRPLYRWLSEVVWPLEASLDPETAEVAAEAALRQLLASGVTAILDMGTTRHTDAVARALARSGIRALFGPAIMDRGPDAAAGLIRPIPELLAEIDDLAARWHGHDGGRLRVALCPRFVPSVSPGLWRRLATLREYRDFPIHTHGSETQEENEEVRALTGTTPSIYLARIEGAAGRVKMAHGVWLTDDDRAALRESGTAVLHCPGSNLKLGSGLADTRALRDAGVIFGLGADGAACNNRLDLWQEMRLAAFIQSIIHGPAQVDAAAILEAATAEGARVLGIDDETGRLRAGLRADLVLLDPEADPAAIGIDEPAPGWAPPESPEALLVYCGSPLLVRETWIDGRVVFRRGEEVHDDLAERVRRARAVLGDRRTGRGPEEGNTGDDAPGA